MVDNGWSKYEQLDPTSTTNAFLLRQRPGNLSGERPETTSYSRTGSQYSPAPSEFVIQNDSLRNATLELSNSSSQGLLHLEGDFEEGSSKSSLYSGDVLTIESRRPCGIFCPEVEVVCPEPSSGCTPPR